MMSFGAYVLLFSVILVLMCSAIFGLWWAIRGGQYSDFARGAASIFDEDEPVGRRTDAFPGEENGHR
jgi:cbb3-type cytochrome oxidase maturation protein